MNHQAFFPLPQRNLGPQRAGGELLLAQKPQNTNVIMDFCNHHHTEVQRLVQQLQQEAQKGLLQEGEGIRSPKYAKGDVEFTKAAFKWVRDEIQFEFMTNWTFGVETTLSIRKGNCFNKACLLNAILRAGGLQAEFVWARIHVTSEMVWRMVPDWVWKQLPHQLSPHMASVVHLEGRWIVLDPAVDWKLAQGMRSFGNPAPSKVDFNGKDHAVYPSFMKAGRRQCKDANFLLCKKPSYEPGVAAIFQASTYFLRTFASMFPTPQELGHGLEQYLLHQCPQIVTSSESRMVASYSGVPVTEFCDSRHDKIQELARRLRRRHDQTVLSDTEYTIRAFYWVRDNILYTLQSDWTVPAHHTLAVRRGMCSTKACLLTALIRAGGLHAGFFIKEQDAGEAFLAPPWLTQFYSTKSVHFLSGVRLHDKWIALDPYVDRYLGQSMDDSRLTSDPTIRNRYGSSFVVNFDGHNHAVANDHAASLHFMENIDSMMRKKSRMPKVVIECHNICLEFFRKFGSLLNGAEEVVQAMEYHLIRFHPLLVDEVIARSDSKGKHLLPKLLLPLKSKL